MFSDFQRRKKKKGIHFEIIPMIDVMMIMVIFLAVMAFLPQVQSAIQTNLPGSGSQDQVSAEDILVTMNADGAVYVNDEAVTQNMLVSAIQAQMQENPQRRVVIAADKALAYEYIVMLLSALQQADIRNVALATEAQN
ncbi:MAG: biopolymer transporter ExbD [Candidatus Sericytochromatia bacterium]|nr:biopolymer transporter ExbD [Candidatus Sericytochromatia bacterium]